MAQARHAVHFLHLFVVELDDVGAAHQLVHQLGVVAVPAEVHVIEAPCARQGIHEAAGERADVRVGLVQGAVVEPVRPQRGQPRHHIIPEAQQVVRGRAVDGIGRHAGSVEFDRDGAGSGAVHLLDILGRQAGGRGAGPRGPSPLVIPHGAQKDHLVTQLARVSGKVQRGPAQPLGIREHVPQQFAYGDDLHSGLSIQ